MTNVQATTTPPRRPAFPLHAALAGKRVLIVDDEDDARDLLRTLLESCDIEVHDAASASEALALLEGTTVDAIVSDIGMPDKDGYALIREVRALPAHDKLQLPAIALTAFTRSEDRKRALLEGFNVHMGKPVEPAKLLSAVAELLAVPVSEPPEPNAAD
jgi:CheY-like chemotaxis protein